MFKISVRTKIFLAFILILLLTYSTTFLITSIVQQYSVEQIEASHSEHISSVSKSLENNTLGPLKSIAQLTTTYNLSKNEAINTADYVSFVNEVNSILDQAPFITRTAILGVSQQDVLARAEKYPATGTDVSFFSFDNSKELQTAINDNVITTANLRLNSNSQKVFTLYYPVLEDSDVIIVIKSEITIDEISRWLSQVGLSYSGTFFILDRSHKLIATSKKDPQQSIVLNQNVATTPLVGYEYGGKDDGFIASSTQIPNLDWLVIFKEPKSVAFAQFYSLKKATHMAIGSAMTLLIVLAAYISYVFTKDIRGLTKEVKKMLEGNYDIRVQVKSKDEVGELSQAFNELIDQLSEKITLLEQQKKELDVDRKQLREQDKKLQKINKELLEEKAQLVAERNKVSVVLQGVTDPIIAVDYDRTIVIFNNAAEKLTGFLADEVLGHVIERVLTLFDKDNNLISPHQYCPLRYDDFEGITYQAEDLRLRTNDKDIHVNITSSKIAESVKANLGCIITLHDTSRERELEKMKIDFVSMAAHELRTPLTTIRGYMDILNQESTNKLTEQEKTFLNRIGIATQQLTDLMENLLSVSRIEKGTYKLSLEPVDWIKTVTNQVEVFQPEAKDRGLKLNWTPPQEEIPLVYADPLRITEVLNNLISNAIKYTPKGSITVSVEYDPKQEMVITHIQDTGQGIPKESLPRMFEKFFRISGVLEQGSKGTGLGLYITKAIVTLHNGEIWVDSEEGVGSVFSFSLPIAKDDKHEKIYTQPKK